MKSEDYQNAWNRQFSSTCTYTYTSRIVVWSL